MIDRFDLGMDVICIKLYPGYNLKLGSTYHIDGCGDLTYWNQVRGKSGYGFSVKVYDDYVSGKTTDYTNHCFTEDEMDEYFITQEEDYKAYQRDMKIKEIIYENSTSSTRQQES